VYELSCKCVKSQKDSKTYVPSILQLLAAFFPRTRGVANTCLASFHLSIGEVQKGGVYGPLATLVVCLMVLYGDECDVT
jgi:hypothetical protein